MPFPRPPLLAAAAFASALAAALAPAQTVSVKATVETAPVPSAGDAADDPAIWIHPADPASSTIIATDKKWGILVYDLAGRELQRIRLGRPNNVDLRYNFPLGSGRVAIVAASERVGGKILVFRVDPATRRLFDAAARDIATGLEVNGICLYVSPRTRDTYAFVSSMTGTLKQWRLFDDGAGRVDAALVRTIEVGSIVEGLVADDRHAVLYVGEEEVALWKYGAEPGDGDARTAVAAVGPGGSFTSDIEGLAIYAASNGTGYLVASDQFADSFVVFRREGRNEFVKRFFVSSGSSVDGVTHTDGLDLANFPLGPGFERGAFVAQDHSNPGSSQNFKLVPWERIASKGVPLEIDTAWDPRLVGSPVNQPPSVFAGRDGAADFTAGPVALSGLALDDGLPSGATPAAHWSLLDGPGTAVFADASNPETTVTLDAAGNYVLKLEASDGEHTASDTVEIRATDGPPTIVFTRRVTTGASDAEEKTSTGSVGLSSGDLEMGTGRVVGVRFADVAVPRGATIVRAYVQFAADESGDSAATLRVDGEDRNDAAPYSTARRSVSSRRRTMASVAWSPAPWPAAGAAGEGHRTPDLKAIVEEIVGRGGWVSGNALAFVVTGSGRRVARSFNGDRSAAPLLVIEYIEP